MRYANFSAINCRNNNYFLEKSDIRILWERLDHVLLVMVNAVNLKLAAVERKRRCLGISSLLYEVRLLFIEYSSVQHILVSLCELFPPL